MLNYEDPNWTFERYMKFSVLDFPLMMERGYLPLRVDYFDSVNSFFGGFGLRTKGMPIKNNTTTNSTTPINPGNNTVNPLPPQSGIEPNEPLPPDPSVIPESSTGGPLPDPNSPDASGSDPGPFPNPSSGSAEPGQGTPADPNSPPPPGRRLRLLRDFRLLQSGTSANPLPPQNNQPTPNPTPN